jgi:hypothetical protein
MTTEPVRATMDIRIAECVEPPATDGPLFRCGVCGQQKQLGGFARVTVTPIGVELEPNGYVEDMPLCESCLNRPDVREAVARSFHPGNIEIISDGGGWSVH